MEDTKSPRPESGKGQQTDSQLDISEIGNEDFDALAANIESFYQKDGTVKTRLSYNWDRNHKMLDGDQWLVYDGDRETGGLWKRLTVSKANEFIPRPVTNYLFDGYQTLKSYILKNKPRSSVKPNTTNFKDRSAAKIADLCLEANWERLCEQENYEYAAACLLTYGTVFKKDFWDTSSAQTVKVPRMEMRPTTDPATGQIIGQAEHQVVDPETGEPQFDELPLGDVNTDVIEPYRIAMDPNAANLHKIKWIMEYSIQPLSYIREVYGKQGDGFTGKAEEVMEESALSGSLKRFHQLKNSSGIKNKNILEGASSNAGDSKIINSAVVKEFYEAPSQSYPKGRLIVVANSVVLYAGDSPYHGQEQGDWHPYSECRWEIVPGRFWGKSPLDAGAEIQKSINSIDAIITLNRKTMAIPQKLIPLGLGIAPGSWTGRPGQEILYRSGDGTKPEIIPGAGLDASVFQERAQRVDDLKTVMGNMDILKGDRPPGVNAASALNMLYEVGTGKLFPVLDRWKRMVEMSQKKQLKIIARYYKEPREQFIRMLKLKNSELSEQAIDKFIGTDLYDNCNVIVEAGSNIPKLQAAKQAALQEAAQAGVLGLEQPANRSEYQRQMGIVGFDNDIGPDQKRAEWENALLDNIDFSPDNKPIVLDVDNHEIHIDVLARRMKEPSFMDASSTVQQAFMAHYAEHQQAIMQKQHEADMQAMAAGQPTGQPQGGAPGPSTPHSVGSGAPMAVKKAMSSDMLKPGGPTGS
jgi:hypothetical protein